jgi:hypothetical protein
MIMKCKAQIELDRKCMGEDPLCENDSGKKIKTTN